MTEYYHTLLEKGGRLLEDGEVVQETDYQILGRGRCAGSATGCWCRAYRPYRRCCAGKGERQ